MTRSTGGNRQRIVFCLFGTAALAIASILIAQGPPETRAAFPGKPGKIVFVEQIGGDDDIVVVNADGSGRDPLTVNDDTDDYPAFSPNGRKIAFSRDVGGDREIFVMNANGTNADPITDTADDEQQPSFSPNGRKIVFRLCGPPCDIWVTNANGTGTPVQLTDDAADDNAPVFSPNGRKIAYQRHDPGDPEEIFTMNADGSNEAPLGSEAGDEFEPEFSPDGRRIAFYRCDVDCDIYTMKANGAGTSSQLTDNDVDDYEPAFSPNGSRIIFARDVGGSDDLFTMKPNGTRQRRLRALPNFQNQPDWQPVPVSCGGRKATLVGTPGGDKIVGTSGSDVIAGLGGPDTIKGKGGRDRLCGGRGDDVLRGGAKRDLCIGGPGDDSAASCERKRSVP